MAIDDMFKGIQRNLKRKIDGGDRNYEESRYRERDDDDDDNRQRERNYEESRYRERDDDDDDDDD